MKVPPEKGTPELEDSEVNRRIVRWSALGWDGIEHLDLFVDESQIVATSVVIGTFGRLRHGTYYTLLLAADWSFKSLRLERTDGAKLMLSNSDGFWATQDGVVDDLAGCRDIDLSGSPFTNTLPIRRLDWEIGQSRQLRMAYVPFDTLVPFADEQIYTKTGPASFRYQSADGSFEQVLTVDEDGLVVTYPTLFRML